MKPKLSLGIAMLGIFIPLIICQSMNMLIRYIIIPTDIDLYLEYASEFSFLFWFVEILRLFCIGQSLFIKDTFFSVIGKVFGALAILLYIIGNLASLLSFNVELMYIAKGLIFILMWLTIILYMLFCKAWIPIKIAGVIAIIPIFAGNIMSIVLNGFMSDAMYEYGETITTVSSAISWCTLILSIFPVALTIIWMLRKEPEKIN
ncbi:MAG: hypothetical protein K2M07_05995 [Muribaculaceae bacterium]|nr:hypothetical protein [Muribaculaceae bacterium]